MKPSAVLLAAAVAAAGGIAQTPHTCEVKRVNEPYYYVTADTHPLTGRAYNVPGYQPPGYWSATPSDPGVPAGHRTWRWLPRALDARSETRQVSGFCVYLRPSAATQVFPFTGYVPEWQMVAVRARADGGREPDLQQAPLASVPQASLLFVQPGAARVRTVFSQPVAVAAGEIGYTLRWQGGEHRLKPGAQGLVGTTDEEPWKVPTWGQIDAAGTVTVTDARAVIGADTTLWLTHYETQPALIPESDFAHLRRLGSPLPFSGFNDGAGLCDLGSQALEVGWNVDAGSARASSYVLPFFNARGSVFAGTSLLLGQTLELDIADPLFGVLIDAGYLGLTGPNGFFDGPRLRFPALGAQAIGLFVGVECLVLNGGLSTVLGSTQAHWIEVVR